MKLVVVRELVLHNRHLHIVASIVVIGLLSSNLRLLNGSYYLFPDHWRENGHP